MSAVHAAPSDLSRPRATPSRTTPDATSTPRSARWQVWGTYAYLATDDPAVLRDAVELARQVIADVDQACSRFRDDSDLVRANARAGAWVAVDPLLVCAVQVAVEAADQSDGLVDPCLGRCLVAWGYDADLAEVKARTVPAAWPNAAPPRPEAWREIRSDPEGALRVPTGVALDLGATAKAWTADLVAATVVDELGCHAVVSLGGDVRADGPATDDPRPWGVAISERPGGSDPQPVWLAGGGLATSSTLERRWAGGAVHHVLDPRTGSPAAEVWRTVTATGPTSVAANVASTAALVLGGDALAWLTARGVSARLVAAEGAVVTTAWPGDGGASVPGRRRDSGA